MTKQRTRRLKSMQYLLDQTPANGCLIVFNAYYISWKRRAVDKEFYCNVLDREHPNALNRDLYLTAKD